MCVQVRHAHARTGKWRQSAFDAIDLVAGDLALGRSFEFELTGLMLGADPIAYEGGEVEGRLESQCARANEYRKFVEERFCFLDGLKFRDLDSDLDDARGSSDPKLWTIVG